MTYPRVNLLKKREQRYQGAVSRSFILLCAIGAPVLIIVLVGGICFSNSLSVKMQLKSSQAVWESYEPRLAEYRKDNLGLTTGGKVLGLFEGWKESQVSFVDLLEDVQQTVPATIQFSRMSIRSGSSSAIYKTKEQLQIDYSLMIDGVAHGTETETQVLLMQKELHECEKVSATFDSVKLASIKNRKNESGENTCDFRLVGVTKEGGVQ